MIRPGVILVAAIVALAAAACGPHEVSASDQKAMEAKYNQQSYEDAMRAAGRGQELEEQKRMDAERKSAGGQ